MKITHYRWVVAFVILSGCSDPPLLSTPLPNGYEFKSNGGLFGYISTPDGRRIAKYFGIISDETEVWCEEFAWKDEMVICKRTEYAVSSSEPKNTNYFLLNTANSEVSIVGHDRASAIWFQMFGTEMPKLATRHTETHTR